MAQYGSGRAETHGDKGGSRTDACPLHAGGAAKQSSIFHVTLARVLEPRQLSREDIARIQAACTEQTAELRGARFTPPSMWCAI